MTTQAAGEQQNKAQVPLVQSADIAVDWPSMPPSIKIMATELILPQYATVFVHLGMTRRDLEFLQESFGKILVEYNNDREGKTSAGTELVRLGRDILNSWNHAMSKGFLQPLVSLDYELDQTTNCGGIRFFYLRSATERVPWIEANKGIFWNSDQWQEWQQIKKTLEAAER
jgi:hypothetical protein